MKKTKNREIGEYIFVVHTTNKALVLISVIIIVIICNVLPQIDEKSTNKLIRNSVNYMNRKFTKYLSPTTSKVALMLNLCKIRY